MALGYLLPANGFEADSLLVQPQCLGSGVDLATLDVKVNREVEERFSILVHCQPPRGHSKGGPVELRYGLLVTIL